MLIGEEKRKLQEEIKYKKEEMMRKLDKMMKKGKITDREEFYKTMFNDGSKRSRSPAVEERNLKTEDSRPFRDEFDHKLNSSHHNISKDKHETSMKQLNDSRELNISKNSEHKPNTSNIIEESKQPHEEEMRSEKKKTSKVTKDEMQEMINKKSRELDNNVYDMITKSEAVEKKILEEIDEIAEEDEKEAKLKEYQDEKNKNVQIVNQIKE